MLLWLKLNRIELSAQAKNGRHLKETKKNNMGEGSEKVGLDPDRKKRKSLQIEKKCFPNSLAD